MCFSIDIAHPEQTPERAAALARQTAHAGPLELSAPRGDETSSRVSVCYPGDGCACRLLRDDADWEAPFFQLEAAVLRSLEQTLDFVVRRAGKGGFELQAGWDEPSSAPSAHVREVSPAQLLQDVRRGLLAKGERYRVNPVRSPSRRTSSRAAGREQHRGGTFTALRRFVVVIVLRWPWRHGG